MFGKKKPELTEHQLEIWREHQRGLRRRRGWRTFRHFILCILTLVVLAVGALYALMAVVFYGPSETAGDLLTSSLLETSALKFVPYIYFSSEHVDEIIARNQVIEPDQPVDTSLIVIDTAAIAEVPEEEEIQLIDIYGSTYRGYLLIVRDPSRVILGVSSPSGFTYDKPGLQLMEFVEAYDAVAAINAGGFEDGGGTGNGGMPLGLVVTEGRVLHSASPNSKTTSMVVGFDQNDRLIVAKMTTNQAKEAGLRDAAAFGPALIVNGVPSEVSGSSSGLNPRTAIGQRADGAVLLLVIDGRQTSSMGASMADLIEIMLEYGAINACNLDGGSSTMMIYEGEQINLGAALTGGRNLPTAFIVK